MSVVRAIQFDGSSYQELYALDEIPFVSDQGWLWIDWFGEPNQALKEIMTRFGMESAFELVQQTENVPSKLDVTDEFRWLLIKGLDAHSNDIDFGTVRIGFLMGKNVMIGIHDRQSVSTEGYWKAVLSEGPPNPTTLLEVAIGVCRRVFDRYLPILTKLETELDQIAELPSEEMNDDHLNDLTNYRLKLKRMRRYATYHAETFAELTVDESLIFTDYALSRIQHIKESIERQKSLSQLFYEDCRDLIEGYLSLSSHRLNQIMKVLTIVTVLFVPLSFLAGIYGMNFEFIPELGFRYGYFVLLGVMLSVFVTLLIWFRRKKWF